MVTINPESKDQPIPDELVLLKLYSIFGADLRICPETQTCGVCSKDLTLNKFGPSKYTAGGKSRVCLKCEHLIAISSLV